MIRELERCIRECSRLALRQRVVNFGMSWTYLALTTVFSLRYCRTHDTTGALSTRASSNVKRPTLAPCHFSSFLTPQSEDK